jgi:hypothetical protein
MPSFVTPHQRDTLWHDTFTPLPETNEQSRERDEQPLDGD